MQVSVCVFGGDLLPAFGKAAKLVVSGRGKPGRSVCTSGASACPGTQRGHRVQMDVFI